MTPAQTDSHNSAAETVDRQTFRTSKGREIIKDSIISHALIVSSTGDEQLIFQTPLAAQTTSSMGHHDGLVRLGPAGREGRPGEIKLADEEEILEVVPAQSDTYLISAVIEDEHFEPIGFEYAGATSPDWDRVIENKRETREWRRQRSEKEDTESDNVAADGGIADER